MKRVVGTGEGGFFPVFKFTQPIWDLNKLAESNLGSSWCHFDVCTSDPFSGRRGLSG